MNPSKIHTKEFFDSLTDSEKFRIAKYVTEYGKTCSHRLGFEDAMLHAHTRIEEERAALRPPPIADNLRCEAGIKLTDEVHEGHYQCELPADHYNQLHQMTYPGLDGYIEKPLYWNDENIRILIRRGKEYFECPGCGFETKDETDLTGEGLCVDCDQLREHNENQSHEEAH